MASTTVVVAAYISESARSESWVPWSSVFKMDCSLTCLLPVLPQVTSAKN